jgi:hypothetical protein
MILRRKINRNSSGGKTGFLFSRSLFETRMAALRLSESKTLLQDRGWGRAKLTCCIFDISIPNIGVYGVCFALFGLKMIDIGTLRFPKLK